MDNCLHGRCVIVGNCQINCQRFIRELGSDNCVECGHRDSQHVLIAIKVMMEGYHFLSESEEDVDIDNPVAEPIAASNVTPSVKAAAG